MFINQVLIRLLVCVLLELCIILVSMAWIVPQSELLSLISMAAAFGVWPGLQRLWLRMLVLIGITIPTVDCRADQALSSHAPCPVARKLLLILIAYHPNEEEVDQLQRCLAQLPPHIGYAVVANAHRPGEPADQLFEDADFFLANIDNPGYGRSVNRIFRLLLDRPGGLPSYVGILNTDLSWIDGTFSRLLAWLEVHPQVSLAVPQIVDPSGQVQHLCKRNPTLLGLFSRRFLPPWCKPRWLQRYDLWYVMADHDYQQVFPATYLSGCCMLVRTADFLRVGGFDESYFLYLEDADLTRLLSSHGACVHLPIAQLVHGWGRGNYRNFYLMVVNLISACHYFRKWGWVLW